MLKYIILLLLGLCFEFTNGKSAIESFLANAGVTNIKLEYADGGSIHSSVDVGQGDILMKLPYSVVLTSRGDDASLAILAQALDEPKVQEILAADNNIALALQLMIQNTLGDKSPWSAIASTALNKPVESTLFWNEDELQELVGTYALKVTAERRELIKKVFQELKPYMVDQYQIFSGEFFTEDSFLLALTYVFAHARTIRFDDGSLVPIIIPMVSDMTVSSTEPSAVALELTEDDEILVLASKAISKGEKIQVNLPMANSVLLLTYGYTLMNNPFDIVPITTKLSEDDIMYDMKKRILQQMGMSVAQTHSITQREQPLPVSVLAALRVQAINFDEMSKWNLVLDGNVLISLRNELIVSRTVLSTIDSLLSTYPTTVEEDAFMLDDIDYSKTLTPRMKDAIYLRFSEKIMLLRVKDTVKLSWMDLLLQYENTATAENSSPGDDVEITTEL